MVDNFQSAKVYVMDFHFSSKDKKVIAEKKKELDLFFDIIKKTLEEMHKGSAIEQIFLRKH